MLFRLPDRYLTGDKEPVEGIAVRLLLDEPVSDDNPDVVSVDFYRAYLSAHRDGIGWLWL